MTELEGFMARAVQGAKSARLLLDAGDMPGACCRAYYAMLSAAQAALLTEGVMPETVKTHATVIGTFGRLFVKTGMLDRQYGKSFNEVEDIRRAADYSGTPLAYEKVLYAVDQAEKFVAAIAGLPSLKAALPPSPQG